MNTVGVGGGAAKAHSTPVEFLLQIWTVNILTEYKKQLPQKCNVYKKN